MREFFRHRVKLNEQKSKKNFKAYSTSSAKYKTAINWEIRYSRIKVPEAARQHSLVIECRLALNSFALPLANIMRKCRKLRTNRRKVYKESEKFSREFSSSFTSFCFPFFLFTKFLIGFRECWLSRVFFFGNLWNDQIQYFYRNHKCLNVTFNCSFE